MHLCQVHTNLGNPFCSLLLNAERCHAPAGHTVPESFWSLRIPKGTRTGENFIGLMTKNVLAHLEAGSGLWAEWSRPAWPGPTCFRASQLPAAHHSQLLQQPAPPPRMRRGPQSFAMTPFVPFSLGPREPNVACEWQAWLLLG